MKLISTTVALLLAPSTNALQMRNMSLAEMPKLPSGAAVAKTIGNLLEAGKGPLNEQLHEVRRWCDDKGPKGENGEPYCEEYERGLRRDLERANRDLVEMMEEAGIDFKVNTYDPKFITDLISFEYSGIVAAFRADEAKIAKEIQHGFDDLAREAKKAKFAQLSGPDHKEERKRDPNDCDDIRMPREECPPNQTEETMVCPGECCWRGPNSPEEEKTFNDFWENRWQKEMAMRKACYLKDPIVREVERELPNEKRIAKESAKVIEEVVRESKNPRNIKELEQILTGLNGVFLGEAERLGMSEVPPMPNPKDTAAKIFQFIGWVGNFLQTAEGKKKLNRELGNMKFDILKETWRAQRDFKRETGISDLNDPQAAKKALSKFSEDLAKGDFDREIEDVARGLSEISGTPVTNMDVTLFATDALDTLAHAAGKRGIDRDIERAAHQVVRSVERAADDVVRDLRRAGEAQA